MKQRIDVLLTSKGYFETREKARAAIIEGLVFVDGRHFTKPGMSAPEDAKIEIRGVSCPFVGRGGYKLEKALNFFQLDVHGLCCIDIGASTGGFTDCLLQHGAKKVYAVDVGYGQLAWKLRCDKRVTIMEKTNFRYFSPESLPEKLDFACGDVSFISLEKIFPPAAKILKDSAKCVFLVKPQFEAERNQIERHGIVRNPSVHLAVLEKVRGFAEKNGFGVLNASYSPIKGPAGNIEFLMLLEKGAKTSAGIPVVFEAATAEAHAVLDK